MNWSTTVLTTVSSDTEPTVIVTFESARYVFNAGENSTRAWLQSRRGWRKVKSLFLTQVSTQRASGIPGMLMSVADSTARTVDIVGPQGILHYLASMRLYVFRNSLAINPIEVPSIPPPTNPTPEPTFKDENITVYSIPIEGTLNADDAMDIDSASALKRKRSASPVAEQGSKRPALDGQASESPVAATTSETPAPNDLLGELKHKHSSPPAPTPLLERLRDPAFSPSTLVGAEAQEWRRRTVEHMFTWIAPPPPEPRARTKGKKKADPAADADPPAAPAESSAASALPQKPHWVEDGVAPIETPFRRAKNSFNPAGSFKQLPQYVPPAGHRSTLAYAVVGPRVRGKFDVKRAEELGLKGRMRGQVAKGETVRYMVDDGKGGQVERVVRPEDCLGESESPGVVLILDVPTPGHIASLAKSFESGFYATFRSKKEEDHKEHRVHVVYHLLGDGVLEDERYQSFMNGFADSTNHLVAARDYIPDKITFTSAAFSQLRLNRLDPAIFPLPHFSTTPKKSLSSLPGLPSNTAELRPNMFTNMRPSKPPVTEREIEDRDQFHPTVTVSSVVSLPTDTQTAFGKAKSAIEQLENAGREAQPGDDVTVVPLGTSSAVTTRYRNVSSQLVQIPGRGNILLDAGEGTWGQLARFFGTDAEQPGNVWQALRELKGIFISHAHADHHAGLAKILAMRQQLDPPPAEPLYLVTVPSVHLYLREYTQLEDLGMSDSLSTANGVVSIGCDPVSTTPWQGRNNNAVLSPWEDHAASTAARDMMCDALGLQGLETVFVRHRTRAYGAVFTHRDGWRLVYSGDTMPTHKLAQAGEGATLLIHEATMGDDQEEMARLKAHSTVGQAIDIGRQMHAQNVLLTHFSTRYPHIPSQFLEPEKSRAAEGAEPVVAMALDHARIRVGDMWKMQLYMPAIEQSFKDSREEGDEDEEQQLLLANTQQTDV